MFWSQEKFLGQIQNPLTLRYGQRLEKAPKSSKKVVQGLIISRFAEFGGTKPTRAIQEEYTVIQPVTFELALTINDNHAFQASSPLPTFPSP